MSVGQLPDVLASLTNAGALDSLPMRGNGPINTQIVAAGRANAADTTDDVLFTYALPASLFDAAFRGLHITAFGKTGGTTNNKQIKAWFGLDAQTVGSAIVTTNTTLLLTSGTVTTNAGGWAMEADLYKYGGTGSNTQIGTGFISIGTTTANNVPTTFTFAESSILNVTVTGASGTTGAASDVLAQFFNLEYFW